ncbi:MAG: hypothetical protein ACREXP_00210 [Steroidobacteraceae bacterium]
MIDQIVFSSSAECIAEGSRLNVVAKFRDSIARADATPTTVHWTLRDPDDCREIVPQTSVTPGTSVTLVTSGTNNTTCRRDERREVTVIVDKGLATQFVATYVYQIKNLGAII